jgi:DNA-directed RNA polymerase specialized sigma24 family protein
MLNTLYQEHHNWISFGIKITGNKNDSEDLVQDMYLTIGKKSKIDVTKNYKAYIFRIMKNLFLYSKRREKKVLVDIDDYKERIDTNGNLI